MNEQQQYFDANKDLWNQRTTVHKTSDFYNVAAFRNGESALTPIETEEVGDVSGKSLLHLQCHFGMDSLSFARAGAQVTGVDFSENAIEEARKLNDGLKLDASFICCNVYDLEQHLTQQFDIVFTSYGVIGWLPDLDKWATLIARYLKPGGLFYMAEFHPVVWMFDDDFTRIQYYYDNREVIVTENQGTYTNRDADIKGKEYSWNHSISEVLNALIKAGLNIEQFNEYTYSPYNCFRNTIEYEPGKWHFNGMEGKIPVVYSVKAVRNP